jgi:murein DD-endopeptidase MepM/ murein hydrolase activator NlpD
MMPLAYAAILAGALLLVAGVTGSTIPSVAQGHPDKSKSAPSVPEDTGASSPSTAVGAATLTAAHEFDGILAAGEHVLEYARKDQGRDIRLRPGAALLANGEGEVLRNGNDPSGFGPSYPIIRWITGPWAGKTTYYGHTRSTVTPGQRVHAGQVVSYTSTTGINAPPGWAEIGFAPGGTPGPFGQPAPF